MWSRLGIAVCALVLLGAGRPHDHNDHGDLRLVVPEVELPGEVRSLAYGPDPAAELPLPPPPVPEGTELAAWWLYTALSGVEVTPSTISGMHDLCGMAIHVDDPRFRIFIPKLIDAMELAGVACTSDHCHRALKNLTGQRFGNNPTRWRTWWRQQSPSAPVWLPAVDRVVSGNEWRWRVGFGPLALLLDKNRRPVAVAWQSNARR